MALSHLACHVLFLFYFIKKNPLWYACCFVSIGGLKSLAEMYESGTGVPQNYETAFTFYEKAATQCDGFGDVESIIKLANYYEEGLGVDQNIDMALAHYLKAAQSRDAGKLYSNMINSITI